MKKSAIFILSFILLISIASSYSYNYGDFSLERALNDIDQSTFVLTALFILIFGLTSIPLKKIFNKDKESSVATVMALAISLLAIYYINKSGISVEGFLYDTGIGTDFLYWFIPLVLIAGLAYLVYKFKGTGLMIAGFILCILAYLASSLMLGFLGILLIIIGLMFQSSETGKKIPWDAIGILALVAGIIYLLYSGLMTILLNPLVLGMIILGILLWLWLKSRKKEDKPLTKKRDIPEFRINPEIKNPPTPQTHRLEPIKKIDINKTIEIKENEIRKHIAGMWGRDRQRLKDMSLDQLNDLWTYYAKMHDKYKDSKKVAEYIKNIILERIGEAHTKKKNTDQKTIRDFQKEEQKLLPLLDRADVPMKRKEDEIKALVKKYNSSEVAKSGEFQKRTQYLLEHIKEKDKQESQKLLSNWKKEEQKLLPLLKRADVPMKDKDTQLKYLYTIFHPDKYPEGGLKKIAHEISLQIGEHRENIKKIEHKEAKMLEDKKWRINRAEGELMKAQRELQEAMDYADKLVAKRNMLAKRLKEKETAMMKAIDETGGRKAKREIATYESGIKDIEELDQEISKAELKYQDKNVAFYKAKEEYEKLKKEYS